LTPFCGCCWTRRRTAHPSRISPATSQTSPPTASASQPSGRNIAQIIARYGDKKDIILGSSAEKLFLGPITDKASRDEIADLLGQHAVQVDNRSTLAPKASAQDLQQLPRWRAVAISGSLKPALIRFEPHWRGNELAVR
jgi:hypothetical protein